MAKLQLKEVTFAFDSISSAVVNDVSLSLADGARLAIVGPSGSGKSTLLHLMAGILAPQTGEVIFENQHLHQLPQDARAAVRLRHFGFVFQFAELLPELSLAENVELPLRLLGRKSRERRVSEVLSQVGIDRIAHRRPAQVSGGERQRAAIARALVHTPDVVFADEPTGALDQETGQVIMQRLLALSEESGTSLIVITHEPAVATMLDDSVALRDGQLVP